MDATWDIVSRWVWGYSWRKCPVCEKGFYLSLNVELNEDDTMTCGLICAELSTDIKK
jgi:hypothetical protein